ncbi:hypothetical protein LZC95_20000 [Pendulispora brunnea]|uniref:Holin n=1 Tax=Pendulispora brunnea TaxID=2905690 RepID=A0ABZ2KKA7_9BACT
MNRTIDELVELLLDHKWVPFAALAIGAVVRVLKSDTPLPTVPTAWRPWLALGLGAVAGVLQAVVGGTAWSKALLDGLTAALTAIAGHDLVIESLRGGKELGTRPPSPPRPPEPPILREVSS